MGLLGPRVGEALHGVALPPDVQTAENLYRHGIVDGVVPRRDLAEAMVRVLAVLADAVPEQTRAPDDHRGDDATVVQVNPVTDQTRTELGVAPPGGPLEITPGRALPPSTDDGAAGSAWDSIARTRRADRPGVREVLARAATDVTVLGPGTSGLLLVLARFEGRSVIVLGQDRGASGPIGPAAFASVHRGLLLAGELGLPVVTMIDTGGAALTQGSEEGGLAGEIARCIAAMMCTTVPTVSVILGQGCGAPALALLPADRTLAAQHAWVAPLSPEGASAILYRCTDRAPELAEAQGIRAIDLLREAIVDTLVPELPDAADEPEPFCARIGHFIAAELATLDGQDTGQRLARRIARYSG